MIHTDIKPENVVFAMSQEEEFDLLYKHVFCTPLIKVYDHQQTSIFGDVGTMLSKSQKKREKKKKKRAES